MKKSSLFISAVLTTFMLAVLAGAVMAFKSFTNSTTQTVIPQSAPAVQVTTSAISAQEAAQIAAKYLGRNDLYSSESASINGMSAYKVTFSSGDIVYVSPQGQIVSVVAAQPAIQNNPIFQFAQPSSPYTGGEHESGDHD